MHDLDDFWDITEQIRKAETLAKAEENASAFNVSDGEIYQAAATLIVADRLVDLRRSQHEDLQEIIEMIAVLARVTER